MGLRAPAATDTPVDHCTTSHLLTLAATYLPRLSLLVPLPSFHLHDALLEAALFLGAHDRVQAHRWADDAESRFTTYLLNAGQQLVADRRERCTLRGWLAGKDVKAVVRELHRAASYHRLLHAATVLSAQDFQVFLLGGVPPRAQRLPSEAA